MSTTTEQTTFVSDEKPAAPKAPKPIMLRSAHDYQLAAVALEHRAAELEKLSKKTSEEGYARESRTIAADASAITNVILPSFREQVSLPLVGTEILEKEIGAALRIHIYRAFDQLDDPKANFTKGAILNRRDTLVKVLTEKLTGFATEVAAKSFDQGYAMREATPEALAAGCVGELRGG